MKEAYILRHGDALIMTGDFTHQNMLTNRSKKDPNGNTVDISYNSIYYSATLNNSEEIIEVTMTALSDLKMLLI